jgi:hypothetical protein
VIEPHPGGSCPTVITSSGRTTTTFTSRAASSWMFFTVTEQTNRSPMSSPKTPVAAISALA